MGVPKFFRWISERYPKINQPIHAPPNPETQQLYFPHGALSSSKPIITNNNEYDENQSESKKTSKYKQDSKVYMHKNSIIPEFDRLYLDMNGIIHCSSHNNASDDNATIDPDTHIEKLDPSSILHSSANNSSNNNGTVNISEEEIFRNVCYYIDRVVTDIVKPKELVYMAIDGVAPRAKMNQQRSRRYRSGKEKEIEKTFWAAHLLKERKEKEMQIALQQQRAAKRNNSDIDDYNFVNMDGEYEYNRDNVTKNVRKDDSYFDDYDKLSVGDVKEVEPGRFTGKFETSGKENIADDKEGISSSSNNSYNETKLFDQDYEEFLKSIKEFKDDDAPSTSFHSNAITPGTPFFERCTEHIQHFIKRKLHTDPRWAHLTIIFSGPRTPGEGEHKIMEFIRNQKQKKGYNPNTRHCLFGQDGDLIMLGLATHEPHFALLREEVIFDLARKKSNLQLLKSAKQKMLEAAQTGALEGSNIKSESSNLSESIESYIHNSNFEILHMSILRDYLAFEFETKEVVPQSPFELEQTIDDFIFMTFFIGNDFLPHLPAIDIADEAFDLLFYTYKRMRWKWLKGGKGNPGHPYLTKAGHIVSGQRLENFLTQVGQHEDPYYDNKQRSYADSNKQIRKADQRAGRDSAVPPDDILAASEEWESTNYKEMLMSIASRQQNSTSSIDEFTPVTSQSDIFNTIGTPRKVNFKPDVGEEAELEEGFVSRMGTLFRNSLSGTKEENSEIDAGSDSFEQNGDDFEDHIKDIKGRYYHDKFQFSPLDAEKHIALRKAYVEGLVWNLQYYYKSCVSWEWFYPYHYGPMLSDLKDINNLLRKISFKEDKSQPLRPFEQLMANLPPSSAELLPRPYQWLMKSPKSPILDFYPESFTVDMNGKRWPWEAVVLLPFIDSERLIKASRSYVTNDCLSLAEKSRNQLEDALVYVRDENVKMDVPALSGGTFEALSECNVREEEFNSTKWKDENSENGAKFSPQLLPGTSTPYPGFPTLRDAPVQALKKIRLGINVFGMRSRYRTAVLEMDSDIPSIGSANTLAEKFIGTTVYFRYPFLQEGFVTAVSDADMTIRGKDSPRYWNEKEKQNWKLKNDTIRRNYMAGEGISGSGGWEIPESSVTLSIRPLKEIQTLADGRLVKVYARIEIEVPFLAALWSPSRPDPRFRDIPARLETDPYRFSSGPIAPSFGIKPLSKNGVSKKINLLPLTNTGSQQKVSSGANILPPRLNSSKGFCTYAQHHDGIENYSRVHLLRKTQHQSLFSAPKPRNIRTAATVMIVGFLAQVVKGEGIHSYPSRLLHAIPGLINRGGGYNNFDFEYNKESKTGNTPPIEFAHGTTTLSFTFNDGIIAAVDSRASIGNFVGSKTTQKVLPISNNILGTMAGGAADCSYWIRRLQAESRFYELSQGKAISVARTSRILADYLYENRRFELSVGTMIMGFDDDSGPSIYYVDNSGNRLKGHLFAVGSGSTFALGVLDTEWKEGMSEEESIALGIKAIRHATFRDAFSGGFIAVYVINKSGWKKVFSEDLALNDKY